MIGMHRGGARATFTVRKVSFGQGVERIFPLHSPIIDKIEVLRTAKVRRAKLDFLRELKGKAARMKETGKSTLLRPSVVKIRAYRTLENALRRMGFVDVAGCDEVGRGCLAGPVVASAVVLDPDRYIPRVCDSKTVTPEERDRLDPRITREAVCWSVVGVDPGEIDRINIHQAGAAGDAARHHGARPVARHGPGRRRSLPHSRPSDGAARRRARRRPVHRDRGGLNRGQGDARPRHARAPRPRSAYGFDRHKGYATREHLDAVSRFGYSDAHRRSFRPPTLFDRI